MDLRTAAIRSARVVGMAHGTAQVAVTTFLGAITTSAATALNVRPDLVTGAAWLGGGIGVLLTIMLVVRRRGLPRKRVTMAGFGFAAAGFLVVALAPHIVAVYVGMAFAPGAILALTPIRTAIARRFRANNVAGTNGADGTFSGHTRAWSYATTTVVISVLGGIVWATPSHWPVEGWRLAAGTFALWVALQGVLLVRLDVQQDRQRIKSPWKVWDMLRGGELRRFLVAQACSVVVLQMVYLSLEPYLARPELFGGAAALIFGLLGFARLAVVPVVLEHGELSNDRARSSAGWAALSLVGSAVVACATLFDFARPVVVVAIVVAVMLLEMAVGPISDATRTYAARIGLEADAMVTVSQQVAFWIGAVIATFTHTPVVTATVGVDPWTLLVIVWLLVAAVAFAVTRWSEHLTDVVARVSVSSSLEIGIRVRAVAGTGARLQVDVDLRDVHTTVALPLDSALAFHGPMLPKDGASSSEILLTRVKVGTLWRRRGRRTEGPLYPFARYPLVLDGRVVGVGSWRSWPGHWRIDDHGFTRCWSRALDRPMTVRCNQHNS